MTKTLIKILNSNENKKVFFFEEIKLYIYDKNIY